MQFVSRFPHENRKTTTDRNKTNLTSSTICRVFSFEVGGKEDGKWAKNDNLKYIKNYVRQFAFLLYF